LNRSITIECIQGNFTLMGFVAGVIMQHHTRTSIEINGMISAESLT